MYNTLGDVPYVKLYRYNPKHLYPKLNSYWDNWEIKLWSSSRSKYCMLARLQNYAATLHCACLSLMALQLLPFSCLPVCARLSCHLMSGYRAISYDIIMPDGWIVTCHLKCLEPKGQVQHQCEGFWSLIYWLYVTHMLITCYVQILTLHKPHIPATCIRLICDCYYKNN
jgi:hypothetical protein